MGRRFKDPAIGKDIEALARESDHRALIAWAVECAERVLPLFEEHSPNDPRPRRAMEVLREFGRTGRFSMKVVREASLSAHAAARECPDDGPARFAARAAGQAVATAHVPTHAPGAAYYAAKAIAAVRPLDADAIIEERKWQYRRLVELIDELGTDGEKVRLFRR